PPLRYRSTGKKSWTCARTGWLRSRRGDPAALRAAPPPRLRRYSPAPRRRRSGASSALVEPAGDLEERLDEVLAMPGRDDMGPLVGDRPRVGRTADRDLPTRRDVDTALPVSELFHHLEGDRLDAREEGDVVG